MKFLSTSYLLRNNSLPIYILLYIQYKKYVAYVVLEIIC